MSIESIKEISHEFMKNLRNKYNELPLMENKLLNLKEPYQEILVTCKCHAKYRVLVNGNIPIPISPQESKKLNIHCKNCNRDMSEASYFSGHSAGLFNVTLG